LHDRILSGWEESATIFIQLPGGKMKGKQIQNIEVCESGRHGRTSPDKIRNRSDFIFIIDCSKKYDARHSPVAPKAGSEGR
jgi:hypothetical protein